MKAENDARAKELAHYVEVANRLAHWIDTAPLPPSALHDVYAAHVLLCELIRQLDPPTEPRSSPQEG